MLETNPNHIAIIMDGNGRWALKRGLPRTMGHKQGVEAVKRVVNAAKERNIKYLTLFSFSSENWNRPEEEIAEIMRLLRMFLRSETANLHQNNINLKVIGDRSQLDAEVVALIENAERLTSSNTAFNLIVALNYGGRQDILNAAVKYSDFCNKRKIQPTQAHAEEYLPLFLSLGTIPDPDLIIRTSGEKRISNFLLWQSAYSEFVFIDTLWPDFTSMDLDNAINEFKCRERRYGTVLKSRG